MDEETQREETTHEEVAPEQEQQEAIVVDAPVASIRYTFGRDNKTYTAMVTPEQLMDPAFPAKLVNEAQNLDLGTHELELGVTVEIAEVS